MPKIESVVRTPRGKEITKETKKKSKFKCFFKRKSAVGDSSQNQNVCKSKKQEALPTIEESVSGPDPAKFISDSHLVPQKSDFKGAASPSVESTSSMYQSRERNREHHPSLNVSSCTLGSMDTFPRRPSVNTSQDFINSTMDMNESRQSGQFQRGQTGNLENMRVIKRLLGSTTSLFSRNSTPSFSSMHAKGKGSTAGVIWCKLCLSEVPIGEVYQLQSCECRFCKECLILYASYEIRQGKVEVTCPDTGCEDGGSLFITELQELVPEEVWNLRERLKLFREIEEDPTRCWCPKPTCEGVCSSEDEVPLKVKQKITCPECQLNFCSKCLSDWHPNPDCQEAPPPHSFAIPADLENVIKRCPFCNIFIERDAGCAQMFCKRCHHMFCWHCLTILDYDYLLRHYTSGPCKGKLGHSRISVLFYRIQFIGIVLGFGLVAILASPLLIVMAPCVCMYGAVCHNRK